MDCLRVNETLIDFEFGFNNFRLEDVSESLTKTNWLMLADPTNPGLAQAQ